MLIYVNKMVFCEFSYKIKETVKVLSSPATTDSFTFQKISSKCNKIPCRLSDRGNFAPKNLRRNLEPDFLGLWKYVVSAKERNLYK